MDFSKLSYQAILEQMLAQVVAKDAALDTREGSVIYTALAPAALELFNYYQFLSRILQETFAATASRDFLILRAAERGLSPKPATAAVFAADFSSQVPLGSRFSVDDLNFAVLAPISLGSYQLQCETAGSQANHYRGPLIPVEEIPGLGQATLGALIVPGADAESTESLRSRYFASLEQAAFGGNIAQYRAQAQALPGIAAAKVEPAWQGGGTVKLILLAADGQSPTPQALAAAQQTFDPLAFGGQGLGLAPIGHRVTVAGVSTTPVDVSCKLTLQQGYQLADLLPELEAALAAYLAELTQNWANQDALVVRLSQIENRFLDIAGVIDISLVKINAVAQNLALAADAIPLRGALDVQV